MTFKIIFVGFIVSIITYNQVIAQQNHIKSDSTKLYENIESYSTRSKFTKFAYRLFFKPVSKGQAKKKYKKLIIKPYSAFEGKTIRHITITTLDPFGNSIADTVVANQNYLSRTGNNLHIKTQPITIRNLLLIRKNQPFDSLLVKESERLVRSMGFVTDVSFYVKSISKNSDSVDVFIRELDRWSLIPKGSITGSKIAINIADKNIAGMGHEFQNELSWQHTNGDLTYKTKYFIPNIRNTHINSTLLYGIDKYHTTVSSFAVDRPFFSPFAKWAAGVNYIQLYRKDFIDRSDSIPVMQKIKANSQDYWAGNAIQVFKGNSENNRTTNFISTGRYQRIRYFEVPALTDYTRQLFLNENLYLASFGISTRKYVQDKYIFKFGITEDVPIGRVISITGGYQQREEIKRLYAGARFSYGKYYPWGYLSTNCEFGTFINKSQDEQGVFSFGTNYFTGLEEIGRWKFRLFVKQELTIGLNRFPSDSLTINDGYGLAGFNSDVLSGTSRLLFSFQTQSYSPWNFIGFRFGPYLNISFGMLGDATTGFRNSKLFSEIGLGVLIKNDNLIINTFQFSIAYYPSIPGQGQNIFKFNSFQTTDFGFRDFEIGKPTTIEFN